MVKYTYSLTMALFLSDGRGVTFETETVKVEVRPAENWYVTFNRITRLTCETEKACRVALQARGFPLNHGWIPNFPVNSGG